jgi:enamine deaminase RidA (YjgF/YER057c/UK114 family)
MDEAKFYQVDGPLGDYYQKTGFSHAVVLPPNAQLVIAAGQPGLSADARMSSSPTEQIESCFDNADAALKAAGVKEGLFKAHKIHCWLTDVSHESAMMEIWRRKWPEHRPTWMTIGTNALCGQGMIVEIQVEAHIAPPKQRL